jgi:hypothetical protein
MGCSIAHHSPASERFLSKKYSGAGWLKIVELTLIRTDNF